MKKKEYLIILLIICVIVGFLILNNNKKPNLKKLVSNLIEKENVLKEEDNYYNPSEYKIIGDKKNGIISVSIYNLDDDSEDEVLIARQKESSIELTLYDLDNNKLVEKDKIIALEEVFEYADILDSNSFVKVINNKPYLFYESVLYSSLVADGLTWKFAKYSIDDGKFVKHIKDEFSGSYFDDEFINSKKELVKENDLNINNFWFNNSPSLYEQNKENSYLMYEIKRNHLENFNEDNVSNEASVLYGKTIYKDYKLGE